MDDGIVPPGGPRRFHPKTDLVSQENATEMEAYSGKKVRGEDHNQTSDTPVSQRTVTRQPVEPVLQHQQLLRNKSHLCAQQLFLKYQAKIREAMQSPDHRCQGFTITFIDNNGKKINIIPPDSMFESDPDRLNKLLTRLDKQLQPLEQHLTPIKDTIDDQLKQIEQALETSKQALAHQALEIPRDFSEPTSIFLDNHLLKPFNDSPAKTQTGFKFNKAPRTAKERIAALKDLQLTRIRRNNPLATREDALDAINSKRSDQDEEKMTAEWLNFYRNGNSAIEHSTWTMDKILAMTDRDLEIKHDYIQLLFPAVTESLFNKNAPLLTSKMAERIKNDAQIQKNIDKSIEKMVTFWGIQWQKPRKFSLNRTDPQFQNKIAKWCAGFNHNQQRITRLLEFLIVIGKDELAQSLETCMNNCRATYGNPPQQYWKEAVDLIRLPAPSKTRAPVQPENIVPSYKKKPLAKIAASPAQRYKIESTTTPALYAELTPFNGTAVLKTEATYGGAGTAAWQTHLDPDFDPTKHKVGVVVASNHGLPLGSLANSDGLNAPITPEKLALKTQEESVTANCILTACGTDYNQQRQWAKNNVCGKWGLKEPVGQSTDTKTIQGIDYTRSTTPEDYSEAWVVENATISAVTGHQLVPDTDVQTHLIFSSGPNANPGIGKPTGAMQRTLNQASINNYQHFRECIKCTVRASLDTAAATGVTHILLAPTSCGVYAGNHKEKIKTYFPKIVDEILDEPVNDGNKRKQYFASVIISDVKSDNEQQPVRSYQDQLQGVSYEQIKKDKSRPYFGFYDKHDSYYPLTNFWRPDDSGPLRINGHNWTTTEHYFQASKFRIGSEEWKNIQGNRRVTLGGQTFNLQYPSEVFNYIRTIRNVKASALQYTQAQWESMKDNVMLKGLRAKAQQWPVFRKLLKGTGTKPLFETSPKDAYWGTESDGRGANHLGKQLMQVREEIKAGIL